MIMQKIALQPSVYLPAPRRPAASPPAAALPPCAKGRDPTGHHDSRVITPFLFTPPLHESELCKVVCDVSLYSSFEFFWNILPKWSSILFVTKMVMVMMMMKMMYLSVCVCIQTTRANKPSLSLSVFRLPSLTITASSLIVLESNPQITCFLSTVTIIQFVEREKK